MRRHHAPRVAFVLPTLNAGGAERAVLNLAAAAPRSRCVVVAESSGGDLASDALASDVAFASDGPGASGRVARIDRLVRILRRVKPDLVVSTLSPLVYTTAAALAGAPVMHWLQAPWAQTTAAGQRGFVGATHRLALRTVGRRSTLIAATTPGLLFECCSLRIAPEKLALLPNGLTLPPFHPRSKPNDGPVVTMVSRLEPPKRPDLLLEAVALVTKERDIRLTIVGSGARQNELKQQAKTLGVAERVTFTGFVSDPYRYISRSDVFALATEYEGFGNVIVEALACGVPAVVSDVLYGPRFILGPTRMGFLVTPGSVTALADGLLLALDRPPTYQERSEGRSRAEEFAIDRVAARFETLVDHILFNEHGVASEQLPPKSWP